MLAIIRNRKKYLLGAESKDSPIKGQWRFLGGHANPGEDSIEGLIREIGEEANISIKVIKELGKVQGDYVNIPICVYLVEVVGGEPTPKKDEISELGWFSLQEMKEINLSTLCKHILDKYQEYI
jgi:8-oxo-dGTP pyrophosphatase MutT (NUDIX family)